MKQQGGREGLGGKSESVNIYKDFYCQNDKIIPKDYYLSVLPEENSQKSDQNRQVFVILKKKFSVYLFFAHLSPSLRISMYKI